ISVKLRDLKGQYRELSKLADMAAGEPPKKSGTEYPTPSDEERQLTKQVNEAKKKGGYEVTDPAKQLKSALDAIKTRLKNQITDRTSQVNSGTTNVSDRTRRPLEVDSHHL